MNCYLCDQALRYVPSWRGIFLYEPPEVLCRDCRSGFLRLDATGCRLCSKPGEGMCRDCLYWEAHGYQGLIESGTSLYSYNEAMKNWFHQYKFLKDVVLAEVFARDLMVVLANEQASVMPIPLHSGKLKERSFSQVDQLLKASKIPYVQLLEKCGDTLGEKTRQQRIETQELFRLNGNPVPNSILLVDDLYTTGTTMRHAAKTLKAGGAQQIRILTLIRA
ncbi:ComF family protein [Planococcus dechangensis]|uniref:Phosphoribosyltransferase family protein n=1 Tax=Planococcus dechangensis TaxID=1176255 RepID=A0ABV9MBB7_9BACL